MFSTNCAKKKTTILRICNTKCTRILNSKYGNKDERKKSKKIVFAESIPILPQVYARTLKQYKCKQNLMRNIQIDKNTTD